MALERYFGGEKLGSFFRTNPSIKEITTAGHFDSAYVSNAIEVVGGIFEYIQTAPFTDAASVTTLWMHFEYYGIMGTNCPFVQFVNSTGTIVAQIKTNSTPLETFQYWDGAAFQTIGSTFGITSNLLTQFDIKITCGVGGTIDIYKNGTNVCNASGMNAAVNNIASVRMFSGAANSNSTGDWSQIFGLNFDTRDLKLLQPLINANGTYVAGTGTYTDINETPLNESTSIGLPAVSDKKSFLKSALTIPGGYVIDSAWDNARVRVSGGVVTDGQLFFRSAGVDSFSASKSVNGAYEPRQFYLATDPATGVAWTQAGYNAAEVGLKAV